MPCVLMNTFRLAPSSAARQSEAATPASLTATTLPFSAQSAMSGFDVRFKRLFYQGKKRVKSEPFFWRYNSLTPVVCGKKP